MADNLNTGGADGRLTVIVESRQAMQALSDIEAKILRLANTANSSLGRTTSVFDRFTGVVKKAAAAFAAFATVRSVITMFSNLVGKIIEVDRAFRGFIASMSIIRGSTQAAVKEYEFLYAISNKLGVQIETSISQYHRLAASLKNVDQSGELARHIFSGISQAAVVLHAKGRDVTLIFEAVQQMASKGKLSLEELQRQLGNTLPGAVSMAARAMLQSTGYMKQGITTAVEAERKLREQIQKGTINVYEFLGLLAQQLKTEYGQGVEYASQQFTANLNRMRNTAYEFFRVAGDSGAIQGLTKIIQEITKLFEDTGNGAREFGRVLGDIFTDVANWISGLDATDVQDFFDAVTTSTMSTWVVLEEFLGIFARFSGPEVNSPLLGFAEFISKTMAAVVDVFQVAVDGIEAAVRSIMAVFLELRSAFGWAMDGIMTGLNAVTQAMPFSDKTKSEYSDAQNIWRGRRERWNASAEANAVAAGRAWKGFIVGDENNAYNRVSAQFDEMRQGRRARAMSSMPGYQPWSLDQVTGNQGSPSWLIRPEGKGAMDITDYTEPLSPDKLRELIDRIKANSGAPNAEGGRKGKGKSAEAEMRRQVREFEKLENAVSRWRSEAGVTEKATEKLRRAKEQLGEAVGKLNPETGELLLTQSEADEIMAKLNERYKEALDPIGYLLDQYDQQAAALRHIGDAANMYTEVLRQQEKWREDNVKYDEADIENLKEKIRLNSELSRIQGQMNSILQETRYKKRDDSERIQAVGQLSRGYTDPSGEFTKLTEGETATAVVDIFGADNMKGTQEYYDAQFEIYQNFLERVKKAREEGLISDATARDLSMQGWSEYWTTRIQSTMDGLVILEGLMNTNSKKMFKIGQAAAIARATITGVEAAINAWNAGMMLGGPFGPVVGAAFMAASIATTASQISKIRSQTPPGFEYGGTYKVGGGGGIDSKRITFDATPGEVITVNTPSQAKAMERIANELEKGSRSGGRVINQNLTIVQQGKPNNKTPEQEARAMFKAGRKLVKVRG